MLLILQTNTFQCVLAISESQSFAMFLYPKGGIQWTTGDNDGGVNGLGGTAALAGINGGDDVNYFIVPGSLSSAIVNIGATTNAGVPGMWIFAVGQGMHTFSYRFHFSQKSNRP